MKISTGFRHPTRTEQIVVIQEKISVGITQFETKHRVLQFNFPLKNELCKTFITTQI